MQVLPDLGGIMNNDREIYLTFDIDWAHDEVIEYVIDYLEEESVAATFFVTHDTPVLNRIRENPKFELGLHPNFNNLLSGKPKDNERDIYTIIENLLKIVPEAKSVRAHCLTQGTLFYKAFKDFGLLYDCNTFIPATSNIAIKPWRFWNGTIIVPFIWSDYIHCMYGWEWNVEEYLRVDGLKVFAFHPIHIALNTADITVYLENKNKFHRLQDVMEFRYHDSKRGTEVFLRNLITRAKEKDFYTKKISDINERSECF